MNAFLHPEALTPALSGMLKSMRQTTNELHYILPKGQLIRLNTIKNFTNPS